MCARNNKHRITPDSMGILLYSRGIVLQTAGSRTADGNSSMRPAVNQPANSTLTGVARSRVRAAFAPALPERRYFLKLFRNSLPSRKALSVQSPLGAGGEVDCLISLMCLTPRPNR